MLDFIYRNPVLRFLLSWMATSLITITILFGVGKTKYLFKSAVRWPNQVNASWIQIGKPWFIYFFITCLLFFILIFFFKNIRNNLNLFLLFSLLAVLLPYWIFGIGYTLYSFTKAINFVGYSILFLGPAGTLLFLINQNAKKI